MVQDKPGLDVEYPSLAQLKNTACIQPKPNLKCCLPNLTHVKPRAHAFRQLGHLVSNFLYVFQLSNHLFE